MDQKKEKLEPKKLVRYAFFAGDGEVLFEPDPNGNWIRYSEAKDFLLHDGMVVVTSSEYVAMQHYRSVYGEVSRILACLADCEPSKDGDEITVQRLKWVLREYPELVAASEASAQHPDDTAVDAFAQAMKDKLAEARAKGRGGWQNCPSETLSRMLREHVEKGDPRDVANFAMFLWSLGYSIVPEAPAREG